MSSCRKRRTGRDHKEAPVQLVSSPSTQGHVDNAVVLKPKEVDPRFEGHCSLVTLIRPDQSRQIIRALRDTGALQSLLSEQSITDCDYEPQETTE